MIDGTTVPRTGKSIPGAFWRSNPADAPFARGLRWAQSFVMLCWLHNAPYAQCIPIHWLPTFSERTPYAHPTSCRSEIEGWIEGVQASAPLTQHSRRSEQLLVCVGDGRGDTKAFGRLDMPHGVCCVRTHQDSHWCDLPPNALSGRGCPRVYSDQMCTPQDKWQQRTGWQQVPLMVREREVRLLVKVVGACRRVGWGKRVFFVIIVRGHQKRTQRSKGRAPMAFWGHAVSDGQGGWSLPVPLEMLLLKWWQRWEVGFRWLKSGFGLGEKPCWGLDSGERRVAWRAWVYGALMWSGYRAWGGWTGGVRGGGCRGRVRWSFRDVWWSVRCELVSGGIDDGFCGQRVDGAEALKNGGVGWCWAVRVVLSWLCAFRL